MSPARIVGLSGLALLVSACAPPAPPPIHVAAAISSISDSAVTVLEGLNAPETVDSEAQRGCGVYGKSPIGMSVLRRGDGAMEHLYACK